MTIKIYTRPTCSHCTKLKEWLKKKKIKYEEFDVAESQNSAFRNDMLEKSGQLAVPVIDVDGEIIIGFDEKMMEKLLEKKS